MNTQRRLPTKEQGARIIRCKKCQNTKPQVYTTKQHGIYDFCFQRLIQYN